MQNGYDESIYRILEDNSFITSYHFDLDTGYGNMTFYHLFDGIDLVYNDFYADNFYCVVSQVVERLQSPD